MHVQTPPTGISLVINPQGNRIRVTEGALLQATVSGSSNTDVIWSVLGGDSNGTIQYINSAGANTCQYYTPGTIGTYTVIATSVADPTKSAQTNIEVVPGVSIWVPGYGSWLEPGDSRLLTASVDGISDQSITWQASAGTILPDGTFIAPAETGGGHDHGHKCR